MYEVIGKGILSEDDENFINQYIPYTSLEKDKKLSKDYVIKPYFGREGQDIKMNYEEHDENLNEEIIFQDRVNIRPLRMDSFKFPIIGAYITGSELAGIYTRMGDIVTDKNAVYISTYIQD